jgi:hypothetical protein
MQSISDIYTKLYEIRVAGVKTHEKYPPYTFNTADYPLLFFRNIKIILNYEESLTLSLANLPSSLDVSTGTAEMVVIVESFRQGTSVQNYAKSRDLVNAIADALNSSDIVIDVDGVEIEEDFELTGDTVLFVIKTKINFRI